ncbi:hypothetical protein D3C85_1376790 [compost metagenome]
MQRRHRLGADRAGARSCALVSTCVNGTVVLHHPSPADVKSAQALVCRTSDVLKGRSAVIWWIRIGWILTKGGRPGDGPYLTALASCLDLAGR